MKTTAQPDCRANLAKSTQPIPLRSNSRLSQRGGRGAVHPMLAGELNEAEVCLREFFMASVDAAVAFDATEEVFDMVAMPVVAAVEGNGPPTGALGRDACARARSIF